MNVPLAIPPRKSAAHSSPPPRGGGNPNPAVLKKSVGAKQILCSRKKCFALPRQHFAPPPARIHGGQNTKEKCPFLFRRNWSRANPKSKEHFSLVSPSGARWWRGILIRGGSARNGF